MSSRKCTTIPKSFSWVLPTQSLVTGVAIYSTVYVFTVGSKPFILAVAAAGLQFILGLYCCFTANRPGIHHRFVVPILLAAIAGVWCGPVYYFTLITDVYLKIQQLSYPGADTPPRATWSYVGLATSCLDVILALALLTIFLVEGLRTTKPAPVHTTPVGYISAPAYGMPPAEPTAYQYQQQQYQYQQPPHPVMTSAQNYTPQYATPHPVDNKYTPTMSTTPISPVTSPISAPTTSPSPLQTFSAQASYDSTNRIDVIRRLCALQHPDGHWDLTHELASLTQQWSDRAIATTDSRTATAAVHACLAELCQYVWTAQRERAEGTRLGPGEMASFQAVGWDLGFARGAIERGRAWLQSG